ncbi:alpha/beta hydrolase [Rhizobium sp. SG_E_25_P2]|uniref:alpha/beta fold hydrolase n=1 Tax=Rhizobium sp. SG_E_25_P2 TaxID=2879942 RepID=UPI0024747F3D|nr:alpha/beta hydrolase [Rhizobium sp. SG_E_25_P2]
MIHGWCGNAEVWAQQIHGFAERYRVVVFDFFADDDASGDEDCSGCSIGHLAQTVVAVADALKAQAVVLVGHSMGGPIAIEAALELEGRCLLVLGIDTFTDATFYRRLALDEREHRLAGFRADFKSTMISMVRRITSDRVEGLSSRIGASMSAKEPRTALAMLEALFDWDIEEHWSHLRCPVEAINSAVLSSGAELLMLPGLSVHLMEAVGHFPMLEDPESFNALAYDILEHNLGDVRTDHMS